MGRTTYYVPSKFHRHTINSLEVINGFRHPKGLGTQNTEDKAQGN